MKTVNLYQGRTEFLDYWKPQTFKDLKQMVAKGVKYYNQKRKHKNLKRETPLSFLEGWKTLPIKQRPKMTIFNEECLT